MEHTAHVPDCPTCDGYAFAGHICPTEGILMTEREADWAITEAMIVYGGGFVQQLGALYRQADEDNQRRLKAAFTEYWARYREIAAMRPEPSR